ncbi:MAG: PfkB family carbohydrate kinase [Rhodothermales bacterium]|nr:PfkB family carbohydrate kinase [Rhodothermales bacterium]
MIIGCLGEVIVDYIGIDGVGLADTRTFRQCPGGAAANVAVGLHALGLEAVVMSKVGNDPAGRFLRAELERAGVSPRFLAVDPTRPTRRAFIAYDAEGRRQVDIVHRQSADQTLALDEVAGAHFDALHVIGTAFLGEITGGTAAALADRVRAAGGWVSFDPNIPLDRISPEAQRRVVDFLGRVDVLFSGESEWGWIQAAAPSARFPLRILTRGRQGATLFAGPHRVEVPAPAAPCVDPTGAGDAFAAGVLAVWARSTPLLGMMTELDLRRAGDTGAQLAGRAIAEIGAPAYALKPPCNQVV